MFKIKNGRIETEEGLSIAFPEDVYLNEPDSSGEELLEFLSLDKQVYIHIWGATYNKTEIEELEEVSNCKELFQPLSEVFPIERNGCKGHAVFYKADDVEELYEEHFTLSENERESRQFSIVIAQRDWEEIGFRKSIKDVLKRKNIRDFLDSIQWKNK